MKAEIDGGAVEGRIAVADLPAGAGSRFEAELKADRLDLDAAAAFARAMAGPLAEWPEEAQLSLDIGRAISAGQELRPLVARIGYGPKTIVFDRLKIGQPDNVMLEGGGNFDRNSLIGKLAFNLTSASLSQFTGLIAPFAPSFASRLNALGTGPGPVRAKLALDLGPSKAQTDGPTAQVVLDLDAPQLKGTATITAKPDIAAVRGIDLDALRKSEIGIETKLSSERGRLLLVLLGLDRSIAAVADGPAQFEGAVTGVWGAPLRLKARISGAGLDADAQGTAEPWAQGPRANLALTVRRVSLAPLFDLKPSDALAQNITLSSRVSLNGGKLTFDDIDSAIAGSRLRGHIVVSLDSERNVEGEVGLDSLDLAPSFALAIGAAGRDAAEPLDYGLLKGWRGRIAFQALRGVLPGGAELRPVSGIVKSDGGSLSFDAVRGGIGGGEATANVDVKQDVSGIVLNARVELKGVDGAALRYRNLAMPSGRTSMQMTLSSQGRSASALTGALSGSGTLTLESARFAGLNPSAFDVAIHASDTGQATDDARLRQIVEPVLSSGALSVKSAQIPFSIRDGRLRISATTLEAEGASAIISGGYDIPADQADIRASLVPILAPTASGSAPGRPEIQLFAAGSPDTLHRTIDVASLSSWLAVRAIDRETRRLDSIERGEQQVPVTPASIPPPAAAQPIIVAPPKPKLSVPRPSAALPIPPPSPQPAPQPSINAPVVSQQVAPLPPPIEVRPAPGPGIVRPRPKPPLVLTPPAAIPPPRTGF
jgi:large subunit ribosomal protein L24